MAERQIVAIAAGDVSALARLRAEIVAIAADLSSEQRLGALRLLGKTDAEIAATYAAEVLGEDRVYPNPDALARAVALAKLPRERWLDAKSWQQRTWLALTLLEELRSAAQNDRISLWPAEEVAEARRIFERLKDGDTASAVLTKEERRTITSELDDAARFWGV
jgi:hypothetical protein